jgi:enoyl-CoA hydratase/carnithine racemase
MSFGDPMTDQVATTLDGGVLTISLNRPEKKNALTDAMYAAVVDALDKAATDPAVRVVLFRGEGADFSAGNDLGDFAAIATGARKPEDMAVRRVLDAMARMEKPVVAAVKGFAVGIGTTLLLHCDLVFVAEDAKLSTPFVNLALAPEAASSRLLPLRIGHVRAFAMIALGEPIDGRTAASWGLANQALPANEVDVAARKAAVALAARPAGSLAETKRLMRDVQAIAAAMERENAAFASRLVSPEAREAFTAFAERRPPDFTKVG